MHKTSPTRRRMIATGLGALGAASLAGPLRAADLTPDATEGPFYPTPPMRRPDVDNDLVRILGAVQDAGGEVITLQGRVLDTTGAPLAGCRVEIWQCDVNGKYMHDGDRQAVAFDAAFQGFGHDITGAEGGYTFRTIKPVAYPGRTPHIHLKVFDASGERLTTQLYIAGHPANGRDRIFARLSEAEARAVSMVFENVSGAQVATVDLVI